MKCLLAKSKLRIYQFNFSRVLYHDNVKKHIHYRNESEIKARLGVSVASKAENLLLGVELNLSMLCLAKTCILGLTIS